MRALVLTTVGIAAALAFGAPAGAQDYPAREIRSVCNFAPGSGADIVVRWYSAELAKLAGKPVVVENKPGAQGNIATDFVAHAKPDGYTILITPASSTLGAATHLFKELPFDPIKDFAPVGTIAKAAFVVLVDARSPVTSIAQLTDHLRAKPGHGSYGTGSNTGIGGAELYKERTGLKTQRVPYRDPAIALTDVLGGQIDWISYDSSWAVGQVRGGKLRALAVTSGTRLGGLPDTPTMAEAGLPGYDITAWWGVVVPAGTPRPIVERLSGWFDRIARSAEAKAFLANIANDPFPGGPDFMAAQLKADTDKWGDIIRIANIEKQ
jgi:tripartite-type tricarboxylate transporter receptor subunit TctC